jgi:hypothetical protein
MPPEGPPPPDPTDPSTGNPVWILPSHAPNTAPPYKYYPPSPTAASIGGPMSFLVFIFFQDPTAAHLPATVNLTSDYDLMSSLGPIGPEVEDGIDITVDGQAVWCSLTGSVLPGTGGAVVSQPVVLTASTESHVSKVIVELHSHPLLSPTVPSPTPPPPGT